MSLNLVSMLIVSLAAYFVSNLLLLCLIFRILIYYEYIQRLNIFIVTNYVVSDVSFLMECMTLMYVELDYSFHSYRHQHHSLLFCMNR